MLSKSLLCKKMKNEKPKKFFNLNFNFKIQMEWQKVFLDLEKVSK